MIENRSFKRWSSRFVNCFSAGARADAESLVVISIHRSAFNNVRSFSESNKYVNFLKSFYLSANDYTL